MKRKLTRLKDLPKNERIFRIVNLIIMLISFLTCIALAIYYGVIGDPDSRLLVSLGIALVMVLPWLGEMIFRTRLSNILFLSYQLYAIVAGIIGAVLNVYNLVWWFDIVVHLFAGYIFSLLGILLISRFEDYKKLSPWTVLFFCLSITLAIELIWELAEWGVDNIFKQPVQGPYVPGFDKPLVTDTMQDILCNFAGGVIFAIHFIIGKFSKHSFGIKLYEKELTKKSQENTINDIENNDGNIEQINENKDGSKNKDLQDKELINKDSD